MSNIEQNEPCGMSEAAIVCSHVALDGLPILQAVRTQRTEAADSGWQFLCNSGVEEDFESSKVWAVHEVLEREPSLREWIESPFDTTLWRPSVDENWRVWAP